MKKLIYGLSAVCLFTLSFSSIAAGGYSVKYEEFYPGWYFNAHLAKTNTELKGADQEFDYANLGGLVGYQFTDSLSAEVMLSFSVDQDTDEIVSNQLNTRVKTSYGAFAGYAAFKTPGDLYFKGKVGLGFSTFSYDASGFESESETNGGFTWGAGVGFTTTNDINFTLEYLKMPDSDDPIFFDESYENEMWVFSIGANYK